MDKEKIKTKIEDKVKLYNQLQTELLKVAGEIRMLNEIMKEFPKEETEPEAKSDII